MALPHAPQNFPFLETRKIRTIISLIPEKPTQVQGFGFRFRV